MISPVKIQENTNGSLQDLVTVSDIVDYGFNANGYYMRFANGTQICYMNIALVNYANPSGYIADLLWLYTLQPSTFPASFISNPYIIMDIGSNYLGYCWGTVRSRNNNSFIGQMWYSNSKISNDSSIGSYIAIGKWK